MFVLWAALPVLVLAKCFEQVAFFLQNVFEADTNVLFQCLQQEQMIFTGKTGVVVSRTKAMVSSIGVNKKSTFVESLVEFWEIDPSFYGFSMDFLLEKISEKISSPQWIIVSDGVLYVLLISFEWFYVILVLYTVIRPGFATNTFSQESFEVASRALEYLGTEPAEPFWMPVRQHILEELRNLAVASGLLGLFSVAV